MSEQNLGEKIKALREAQGLTREQLYARTKILVKYIEAIEDGRWDLLPGQVYLKPFIKNIAEALDADYNELSAIIDKADIKKPEQRPVEPPRKKGFDYRWLAVLFVVVVVGVIIIILRPVDKSKQEPVSKAEAPATEPQSDHTILNHDYSSSLDMQRYIIDPSMFHSLELMAIDSVWLVLTAGSDTLFAGILNRGQVLTEESAEPFALFMGRTNCLDINYDHVELDKDKYFKDKRFIEFAKIEPPADSLSGD